jgi:hypothetical protein
MAAAAFAVGREQQRLRIEGGASPQAANVGDAISAFSFRASSVRSLAGKNASISNTPSLRSGGVWISPIRAPRSRSRPARHAFSIRFESSTCSRLDSGSAVIRRGHQQARHGALDLVAQRLGLGVPGEGGAQQRAEDVQRHAGAVAWCVDGDVGLRPLSFWICSGPGALGRQALAPGRRRSSRRAARRDPAGLGVEAFTHGWKLAGARSGNVSARLPMSPLGSMISAGIPPRSASSSRTIGEPGLAGAGHPDDDAVRRQVARADHEVVRPGLPVAGSMILPSANEPRSAMAPSV